ncbi:MAG: helix-turn-helix transcriptional regulator [Myxococcota bacterium]
MYELIVLSLVVRRPTSGYVVAGVINDVIGPYARASNGRIYPLLAKLTEDGLLTVAEEVTSEGGRTSRSYAITDAGRARFHALMVDTSSSPREYRDLFAYKVTAFGLLAPAERVALLRHYLGFCRGHLDHLASEEADFVANASSYTDADHVTWMRRVFGHLAETWAADLAWAERLLAAELATG